MTRRLMIRIGLSLALLLATTASAFAGGWAVVTLDELPTEVRAGQALSLGFMVRQHGQTPIDSAFGEKMVPILSAANKDTGETVRAEARKEGPVGHFVVDVTFPSAGTWSWEITPAPFEGTKLGDLTVLPPLAAAQPAEAVAPAPAVAPAEATAPAPAVAPFTPAALRWAALLLLVVAAGLIVVRRRATLRV